MTLKINFPLPNGILFYVSAIGFYLSLLAVSLFWNPIHYSAMSTITYILLCALFGVLFWTFPGHLPNHTQWIIIIFMTLAALIVLIGFPISDDVNRYVWEGYIANHGINPYIVPPAVCYRMSYGSHIMKIWQGINHKNETACYPPFSMIIFRTAAFISPTLLCFKILIYIFDIGTVVLLGLLVQSYKLPPKRLLLYALNPLTLIFGTGECHLDVIQIFFIFLCYYLLTRGKTALAFFSLGCAIMTKYFAIVLFPFLIDSENWKKSFVVPATLAAIYLPFRGTGSHLWTSLADFVTYFSYNDSITAVLRFLCGSDGTRTGTILLGFCLFIILLFVQEPLKSGYLAAGALLLLVPVLNPWYLIMITAFMVFFPSRAWLYLHLAIIPALYLEYFAPPFFKTHLARFLEYLPFYGLMIFDFLSRRPTPASKAWQVVHRVSVVIPVLNESNDMAACLDAVQGEHGVKEIIVVDGGSMDGTAEIARVRGARVIETHKGRGHQIKIGIEQASADVVLVLHADCRLRRGTTARVLEELNRMPRCPGGAMGMEYLGDASITGRMVSWLNNARARWIGISFGDQGQFLRKDVIDSMGGYPDLMLMEDVELSMRLKEIGPLCFVPGGIQVSARRWERLGFWATTGRVIRNNVSYLIRRRLKLGDANGQDFYDRYYPSKQS